MSEPQEEINILTPKLEKIDDKNYVCILSGSKQEIDEFKDLLKSEFHYEVQPGQQEIDIVIDK